VNPAICPHSDECVADAISSLRSGMILRAGRMPSACDVPQPTRNVGDGSAVLAR